MLGEREELLVGIDVLGNIVSHSPKHAYIGFLGRMMDPAMSNLVEDLDHEYIDQSGDDEHIDQGEDHILGPWARMVYMDHEYMDHGREWCTWIMSILTRQGACT